MGLSPRSGMVRMTAMNHGVALRSVLLLSVLLLSSCGPRIDASNARNAALHAGRLDLGLRVAPVAPGTVQLVRNDLDPAWPVGSWWRTGESLRVSDHGETTTYTLIGIDPQQILVAYESTEDLREAEDRIVIDRGVVMVPVR